MAGHHDPRLLYSVSGIQAYHIRDGEEIPLTPNGPQTLSLLMVPTSSPFADLSTVTPQNEVPEEDFYLHLNLPPELDLSLPATTQIYHQPPTSYLIPRWDLGPDAAAFTRIEFPPIGHSAGYVSQEDVDTFETILAQCTAFLERAQPPNPSKGEKDYNPSNYGPGEAYAPGTGKAHHGQLVLINEDDGSVLGELTDGAQVMEDPALRAGNKNPVQVHITDGGRIDVSPVSDDYLHMANHPAYKSSSLVQNAAAASRLIVTTTNQLSNMLTAGADTFTQKTKPLNKPMSFGPAAHQRARKINSFTHGAAGMSAKTVGQASKYAQNIGASMTRGGRSKPSAGAAGAGTTDRDGKGRSAGGSNHKPGFLNKSMIAFSTIADGIEESGKRLLTSSGAAATTVVGHRYGNDARQIAAEVAGGVKNVGLVYIDVAGVSRKAVLKSVAKGMVVGRVKGGGEVIVGGGDGEGIMSMDVKPGVSGASTSAVSGPGTVSPYSAGALGGTATPPPQGQLLPEGGMYGVPVVGYGNAAATDYGAATGPGAGSAAGVGEPLGNQTLQGQQRYY